MAKETAKETAKGMARRKTCKEILLDKDLITEDHLSDAHAEMKKSGKLLQQVVVDMKLAAKGEVLRALAMEWDVKAVDLSAMEIDPDVVRLMPKQSTKRYFAVPFAKEENVLLVAMAEPRDLFAVEDIQLRTGFQVEPYLAMPDDIRAELEKIHGSEAPPADAPLPEEDEEGDQTEGATQTQAEFAEEASEMTKDLLAGLGEAEGVEVDKTQEQVDIMQVDSSAPEVEKLVNAIILEAMRLKASDIHIEPYEKKIMIRYRVDGNLRRSSFKVPISFRQALIAKIKIMTVTMNITERRVPQDGRIQIRVKGKPLEFRVNIVPSVYGEAVCMRILDRSGAALTLDQLGFLPNTKERFMKSLDVPYGLILVVGPTGSGKSFTLMASLTAIRDPEEKILTAENPVEYNLDGVVQVQVNPDLKMGEKVFDFALALRAFLRHDPDIVLIGEIRDQETAQIAMEAAMTGHVVLSTLHTNDAPTAVTRLAEMGVHTYLIGSTMECVLAQRLIQTLCKSCKVPDPNPSPELLKMLDEHKIDYTKATFMTRKGCPKCGNRGMKGRTAIHELLQMNQEIRKMCVGEVDVHKVKDAAQRNGMLTLLEDGLTKVTLGLTTYEEILAAAQ